MPFDPPDYKPPEPETPRPSRRDEDILLFAIAAFALAMLLLPIGGGSLVQLVAYLLH